MSTLIGSSRPYALEPGAGERMAWFGSNLTLKASVPEAGIVEAEIATGDEPPMHVHANEDEWFYLLEGEMLFHVGTETFRGTTGSVVSFPRGIPHTFTVVTPTARFLLVNTPGGFELMFRRAPATPEEAVAALADYGAEVVGPHPRDSA
jgi:quercetin dioxygenase-like cupin family protein